MTKVINLHKLFNKYNIPYRVSSGGKEIVINCPFHDDHKAKLGVNVSKGVFRCWVCNESGTVRYLVKEFARLKKTNIDYSDFKTVSTFTTKKYTITETEVIPYPEGYGDLTTEARNYLLNRGLTDSQISYYKIGYCSSGSYRGRVIVPVFNENQELVSFIARTVNPKLQPKVLTPPAKEGTQGIKNYIFNLHNACKTGQLYIGEGIFDAISLGSPGVCLFGKTATNIQLAKIINKKVSRITIVLDPDAELEANLLYQRLQNHCDDVRIAKLPVGTDPNSVDKNILQKAIKEAHKPELSFSFDFIGEG